MARAFIHVILQRVMGIIFPGRTYDEALVIASYERLDIRRKKICIKTLRKIIIQSLYKCRTERVKNSFFPSTCRRD